MNRRLPCELFTRGSLLARRARAGKVDSTFPRFTLFWRVGTTIHAFGTRGSHSGGVDSQFGSHFLAGETRVNLGLFR